MEVTKGSGGWIKYWVTVRKAGDIYTRCRRVPLSEVYSSISENFQLAYTGTSVTERSRVEMSANVQYG